MFLVTLMEALKELHLHLSLSALAEFILYYKPLQHWLHVWYICNITQKCNNTHTHTHPTRMRYQCSSHIFSLSVHSSFLSLFFLCFIFAAPVALHPASQAPCSFCVSFSLFPLLVGVRMPFSLACVQRILFFVHTYSVHTPLHILPSNTFLTQHSTYFSMWGCRNYSSVSLSLHRMQFTLPQNCLFFCTTRSICAHTHAPYPHTHTHLLLQDALSRSVSQLCSLSSFLAVALCCVVVVCSYVSTKMKVDVMHAMQDITHMHSRNWQRW